MSLRIGVTGGIGSGKTLVCTIIESLGYPVFYSDWVAKWLTDTDPFIVAQVKEIFGSDIYIDGKLDRRKVSKLVFANSNLLGKLNSIIHPAVAQEFENWCTQNSSSPLVFKEAAILFETGAYRGLHKTILVTAPVELRVKRVVERDGVGESDVMARMANQLPDEEKCKLADFVIDNSSDKLIIPQVLNIIQALKAIKHG